MCWFHCWIHRMITSHYIMTKIIHCCIIAIYAFIKEKAKAFKCVIYKTNYIRTRLSEIRSNSLQHVSIYSSSEEHLGDSGNLHSSVAQITALLKPYVSEFVCKAMCVCVRMFHLRRADFANGAWEDEQEGIRRLNQCTSACGSDQEHVIWSCQFTYG